ncbi:hypothetical protein VTK73DRAFT_2504 [Phialemonium thermophilum]|uniref:Autophagy-related protein 29 n=1 Tax=Phialemonium thermophilum TaxID=223376 RepID=A0ABR3Y2C3_9PEZI
MALNQGKEASDRRRQPKYHVYIRLPFERGDFVDPPPVDWDETKSEALWSVISSVAKTEIEWSELASAFGVTVEFLLQMASYLTEHHTSQLRAQMRKVAAAKGPGTASPVPGSGEFHTPVLPPGAEAMRRTASGGGGSRGPSSSFSARRDSPIPRGTTEAVGSTGTSPEAQLKSPLPTVRPLARGSRTPSSNTAVLPSNATSQRHRLSSLPISPTHSDTEEQYPHGAALQSGSPRSSSPVSSTSSSSSSSPVESRIIRRPPRFQPQDASGSFADDDEAEPAFLPFKPQQPTSTTTAASSSGQQDLASTLRGDPRAFARRATPSASTAASRDGTQQSQTSDSSASSSAAVVPRGAAAGERRLPLGPLSPRRTAELAGRSPGGKGKGVAKDGSDGTPSMGSSFSDLDDASVTQSALEEALASKMQEGGTIGSRMSTISQAIRSRYLPKTNRPS